jgi:hypothetical protein
LVPQVHKALLAAKVIQGLKVLKVLLVNKAFKAIKVILDPQALKDQQGYRVAKVR